MEAIFTRQKAILDQFRQIESNYGKDSASRKTSDYIQKRLEAIDNLWGEFDQNNRKLQGLETKSHQYFTENIYQQVLDFYKALRDRISSCNLEEKATQHDEKISELLSQQRTNFRAFSRLIRNVNTDEISEKWEIEDELRNVQSRWNNIDSMHLQIDNILQGSDIFYDDEFSTQELAYKRIKRVLNQKLCSSVHVQQVIPTIDLPVFTGKYTQWPTFFDLFVETIHNSKILTKAQKMQHLKGKVRGEAERLIQHLTISAENYDAAWEILIHRYNNPQLLFTKQIELFLNQPNINKQSSFELKKLYDTSTECIHAIHNLGVDTNTWDPLLVHLLSKKLDIDTYTDYKEARKSPRDLPSLEEFMEFLEAKFIALEPIHRRERDRELTLSKNSQSSQHHSKPSSFSRQGDGKHFSKFYKAAPTYTLKCPLCSFDHELYRCHKFVSMSAEAKFRTVSKYNICQNCLYKHADKCHSAKRCKECNSEHNTLLHDAFAQSVRPVIKTPSTSGASTSSAKPINRQHSVNHVASDDEEVLLTTVSLKVKAADGTYLTLRALLDQGSQIALISENAAQMLDLQRQRYHASVSGIGNGSKASKGVVSIECQSIYNNYCFSTQALVISRVINNLPTSSFSKQSWPHLQHINLADPDYNVSKPIDILLDASIYSEIIMSGLIKGPIQAPIAQQTKLGWILSGNVKTFNCHVVINNLQDIAKYWELEDINESTSTLTREEQYCEDFYQATTERLESGRYVVALPMKPGFEEKLGTSKQKAIAQFKQLEHKMSKNSTFSDSYKQFIHEYQQLEHMRPAEGGEALSCFLPHHGVLKLDSSTTKLRVVFNGSSKTTSGYSLNDLMECGPNLQVDLQDLILRWRQYRYVITADIEKMFRQIFVRKCDQALQSIIWRDDPSEPLQEFRLTSVTYGTKAGPFLSIRTLRQLAKDDALKYPLAAAALGSSFFTDDLLSGHDSIEQTKELQYQLIEMLRGAGMNLRKWSANTKDLVADLSSQQVDTPFDFKCSESRKTLGLQWHPSTDDFTFQNKVHNKESHTKRQLLSDISKIFDPLGWLSPLTIRAKVLFQKAWTSGISWDDKLTKQLQDEWFQLRDDLQNISQFSIPRYLGNTKTSYRIHGFCDASEKAYACSIYLVTSSDKGECISTLIIAKTRLAPLTKKLSLPRLELCGAELLSSLMKKVTQAMSAGQASSIHAWTDSMVVLGWIHGDITRWKQFVANRVSKIKDIIPASHWNHVRSEDNPSDSATRGASVKALLDHSLWWQGPRWLHTFDPNDMTKLNYQGPDIEIKQISVNTALCNKQSTFITELLQNYNSVTRVIKTIAWVSRFVARLRHRTSEHSQLLSPAELSNAYNMVIKHVQYQDFEDDIVQLRGKGFVRPGSKLASLCPYLDEHGILRVGGRLSNSYLSNSAKHPVILSHHSRLTDLIISQAHITTLHGGPRLTLSYIREKFWILSGMNTVKRQIRLCVKCRRYSTEKRQQIMADLPHPRVRPSRPFSHTGVDFTGHVDLKSSKGRGIRCHKGYIAIFVCLSTKAVHLELVSDLSTPAFLAAFRRFCARRGTPSHMYSDNGTNFVGSNRLLKKEYKEITTNINHEFFNNIAEWDIKWSFNSPAWPTAGGLWEGAVKSFKHHLKRTLGEQKLTYEEFTTLIQQIEACLNSRPLFALTENPEDDYLTPGHFLIGGSLLSRPQGDDNMNLPNRWQLLQAIMKHFWKKWSTDYLQHLQTRSKWRTPSKNIDINDIVLIKDDNLPPGKWVMGRVHEIHPGRDGYVRVVSLKTQNSILKRPITKLVLLPVHDINSEQPQHAAQQEQEQSGEKGRAKRCRKKGAFMNLLVSGLLLFTMLFSPSLQQEQRPYVVTQITDDKGLYFDKITDLQYIRDEWKLVVYYNLSTYYQGLLNIQTYVNHLQRELVHQPDQPQYKTMLLQLDQELSEIQHYNTLLHNQYRSRQKRSLIDGVGYALNSLFGVLDERFAKQYAKDIEQIVHNEKHLQKLIKNQTIVLEAAANIIQRNEKIMNTQFKTISEHIHNISDQVNHIRFEANNGLYVTSSALVANIIINNLRRIQETLINTITNILHGRIDTHLLSPDQLEYQILTISSQLQGDLTVPVEQTNFADMYKMLKVSSRIFSNYLIIEIKIPLVSKEIYELDRVISIPQIKKQQTYYIIPSHPYLAFNLRKDTAIFLSENDITSCLHTTEDRILCSLDTPIYNIKMKESICQLKINNAYTKTAPCEYKQSSCDNRWIKLHAQNDWLFSCCQECSVRIFCTSGVSIVTLSGNGLVTLGRGCVLKDNDLSIYTHNNYMNRMTVQSNIKVPELSILNNIINTTITEEFVKENHTYMWKQLQEQIEELKGQSYSDFSIHDIHHYTMTYVVFAVLLLVGSTLAYWKLRSRCRRGSAALVQPPATAAEAPHALPRSAAGSVGEIISVTSVPNKCNLLRKSASIVSVDQGTSPIMSRSVSFHVPSVESRE